MRTMRERGGASWGRYLAGLGAGMCLLLVGSGCGGGNTPKSTTGVVAPGGMDATKQQQYADQMKNRRPGPGGGPGGPGGPSYPGGPGGGPGAMPPRR